SRRQLSVDYDSHPDLKPDRRPKDPDRRTHVVIITAQSDPDTFAGLRPGDVRGPAMLYVGQRINEHIASKVETRIVHVPRFEATEMIAIPETFLSGLWLQFAQAVAGGKQYARCKECQTWFETSLPGARKTRMYCSDLCKVKAYQGR